MLEYGHPPACLGCVHSTMTDPNRRILIVDDNRAIHEDFYKILQGRSSAAVIDLDTAFELSSAYQGDEGVEQVRAAVAAGRPFALAVIDVRMPTARDGLDTIARMWDVDPALQVVICTAYSDATWRDIVQRFGATDRLLIVKKPFEVVELCQLALALTEKWQLAYEARTRMAELVQSRADLAASLALARAVQEATADGLLVVGDHRRVSTVNRRFLEMWRMPPELVAAGDERMVDSVRDQLIDPDAMAERVNYFYGHPHEAGNDELHLKDGRVIERWTGPVRSDTGEIHGRLWWFRDITGRRKLELDRAVVSERMASMGRLAAGVGHEINNPLTYALGNVDGLIETTTVAGGPPATADLLERLHETRDGLWRIRVIVRDLQTLSRADEAQTELDLKQVVEQAIQIAGAELRHRAPVVRNYQTVSTVLGSRTRLGQVFLNLIVNAAQAIREGRIESNRIEIAIRDVGTEAVVEVTDTGTGIAAEHLDRIFDPFFTTKPVGSGTGLGLSISREIVTRHGGSLTVSSAVGFGTTMTVRLPHGQKPAPGPVPTTQPLPTGQRARILVIDDEPLIAKILQRGLARHHVTVAGQARDALARIEQGERFDVILCDLMMPDINGIDVHEYLSKSNPSAARKMVFMTGGAFTARAKQFLSSITNERVEKPFSMAQITELIDRQVEARRRGAISVGYGVSAP
jgi:signal transduction histidine kinase